MVLRGREMHTITVVKPEIKDHMDDLGVDGRTISKNFIFMGACIVNQI